MCNLLSLLGILLFLFDLSSDINVYDCVAASSCNCSRWFKTTRILCRFKVVRVLILLKGAFLVLEDDLLLKLLLLDDLALIHQQLLHQQHILLTTC